MLEKLYSDPDRYDSFVLNRFEESRGRRAMIPFLKYKEGARPGKNLPVKRPSIDDSNRDAKKRYEAHRERKFIPQWEEGRKWLRFDPQVNKMYCTWCIENNVPDCKFVYGTDNFKLCAVKQHEESKHHKHIAAKYDKPRSQSDAKKCMQMLQKADYDRLTIKFRTAHAVAKYQKSFRDYTLICRLDAAKGLDVGAQYINDKAGATFVKSIANVTREYVIEKLLNANFFSFTCDGSTDFTGEEQENFYVRVCTNGVIEDIFFHIGSPESTSARDIFDYIVNLFDSLGLGEVFRNKLVGFCADGASNMQGKIMFKLYELVN